MKNIGHRKLILNRPSGMSQFLVRRRVEPFVLPLAFIVAHFPLGLLLYRFSALALIHPLIVFCVGLYWATRREIGLEKVACVVAYIIASEVLWRMAQSSIFWEFGKYASATIMIVALVTRKKWQIPSLPLLYFVFLLPACVITIFWATSLTYARGSISFNMSGPLALFAACWFFSQLKVNENQLKTILFYISVPLISVAVTTLFYAVTTGNIQFNTESNHALSGGFGPNQVSSMLGLGVYVCLISFLAFKNDTRVRIYLIICATFFTAQSVLTFSRGGMYTAIGATLVGLFFMLKNFSQGLKRLIPIIGMGAIFLFFIFPYMNAFTGGKLKDRFEESGTTNRTEIIQSDFQLFLENPVFGKGVGQAFVGRAKYLGFVSASHTEFSRVVSEHGSLGVLSLLFLVAATFSNLKRQKVALGKAIIAGSIVWSALFMLNAGMRLAAPSILWGLSFVTLVEPGIRRKKPASKRQVRSRTILEDNN